MEIKKIFSNKHLVSPLVLISMSASVIVPTIIISKNVQQSPINKEVKEIFNSIFSALPSDLSKTKNGPQLNLKKSITAETKVNLNSQQGPKVLNFMQEVYSSSSKNKNFNIESLTNISKKYGINLSKTKIEKSINEFKERKVKSYEESLLKPKYMVVPNVPADPNCHCVPIDDDEDSLPRILGVGDYDNDQSPSSIGLSSRSPSSRSPSSKSASSKISNNKNFDNEINKINDKFDEIKGFKSKLEVVIALSWSAIAGYYAVAWFDGLSIPAAVALTSFAIGVTTIYGILKKEEFNIDRALSTLNSIYGYSSAFYGAISDLIKIVEPLIHVTSGLATLYLVGIFAATLFIIKSELEEIKSKR